MAHYEHPGPAWPLRQDAIQRPIGQRGPLVGPVHRVGITRRAAVAGPVKGHNGESRRRAGVQQGKRAVARAVEIPRAGGTAMQG